MRVRCRRFADRRSIDGWWMAECVQRLRLDGYDSQLRQKPCVIRKCNHEDTKTRRRKRISLSCLPRKFRRSAVSARSALIVVPSPRVGQRVLNQQDNGQRDATKSDSQPELVPANQRGAEWPH